MVVAPLVLDACLTVAGRQEPIPMTARGGMARAAAGAGRAAGMKTGRIGIDGGFVGWADYPFVSPYGALPIWC